MPYPFSQLQRSHEKPSGVLRQINADATPMAALDSHPDIARVARGGKPGQRTRQSAELAGELAGDLASPRGFEPRLPP